MNKFICTLFVILSLVVLNGCAGDTVQFEDAPDYADYSPGYTGYTVGYDGYGTYDDGYGPSFWNPRYYFYSGHNHGYQTAGNQH
ncbi:MAG: hypothetical protein P1U74_09485 [Legionellaceae bacterium]|nr:hypothetical protein [Legionellaceae bacterium]